MRRTAVTTVALYVAGFVASALLVTLVCAGRAEIAISVLLPPAVVLFMVIAPPGLLVLMTAVVLVISPTAWPHLGELGGADVYLGDAFLLLFGLAALLRVRHHRGMPVLGAVAAFVLYGLVRGMLGSATESTVTFLRIVEPVLAGTAVGLLLPRGFGLWRTARWALLGVLATVPFVGDTHIRWSGLPGGPNEVALVAAVLVVLGAAATSKSARSLLVLSGLWGLVGTRGIIASAAALTGLAVLSLGRRLRTQRGEKGLVHPLTIACAAVVACLVVPRIRPDLDVTIYVHTTQAQSFWSTFASTNPLIGGGWSEGDSQALVDAYRRTDLLGLHNVYLDIAVFLGVVGLGLFLLVLWCAWRSSDRLTRAVLVTVAVWFNTTGAFPGVGWGLLGLVVAACVRSAATPDGVAPVMVTDPAASVRMKGPAPAYRSRSATETPGGVRQLERQPVLRRMGPGA
ncbi:hypothetical protein DF19_26260 [Streptomyces olindensis]|nr:hypothetical protein DF19_26260 [Streptomyces olindensis]